MSKIDVEATAYASMINSVFGRITWTFMTSVRHTCYFWLELGGPLRSRPKEYQQVGPIVLIISPLARESYAPMSKF